MGTTETALDQVAGILRDARTDLAIDLLRIELSDARREIEILEASRLEHERMGNAFFPADPSSDDRVLHRAMAGYLRPAIERARDIEGRLAKRLAKLVPQVDPAPLDYLDAVNRDEARIAIALGRGGVRYVGD